MDETVQFVAGSYNIDSENKLLFEGREVLYLLGSTSELCGCCASSDSLRFITVPGFITGWKSHTNEAGIPVSDVETIAEEATRLKIKKQLEAEHDISNISFW
jgi:hypothetical protein